MAGTVFRGVDLANAQLIDQHGYGFNLTRPGGVMVPVVRGRELATEPLTDANLGQYHEFVRLFGNRSAALGHVYSSDVAVGRVRANISSPWGVGARVCFNVGGRSLAQTSDVHKPGDKWTVTSTRTEYSEKLSVGGESVAQRAEQAVDLFLAQAIFIFGLTKQGSPIDIAELKAKMIAKSMIENGLNGPSIRHGLDAETIKSMGFHITKTENESLLLGLILSNPSSPQITFWSASEQIPDAILDGAAKFGDLLFGGSPAKIDPFYQGKASAVLGKN